MDTIYANVFVDAWSTVLESFCTKQIVSAEIKPPKEYPDECDLFVFMGLVGDLNGEIFMSMDKETAKVIASEMLGGMEINDAELITSAVGELCNMIMGNACSNISLTNTSVDITPPAVFSNKGLPHLSFKASYCITIFLEDLKAIVFNVAVLSS